MNALFDPCNARARPFRLAAIGWAVAGATLCACALGYHAAALAAHQRELHKIINYAPDAVMCKDGKMVGCLISVGSVQHYDGPQFFAFITPVGEDAVTAPAKLDPVSTANNAP